MAVMVSASPTRTTCTGRYDRDACNSERGPMADAERDALEVRVRAGEWLLTGEVARLLGVDRVTVWRWTEATPPYVRFRHRPGRGRYREIHPADVLRELDAGREVHGG
jgi:hypothetical protein